MYYCTHSDINYLAKGLSMCQSINAHDKTAIIFYLCLDEETFQFISNSSFINSIVPIHIDKLNSCDARIKELKNCQPSNYGTAYSQYCWSLTPCLVNYLLNYKTISINELIYCDADLFFYNNPKQIAEACKNHSVGIHTHRFSSYDSDTNDVGEFNVGCVYFKNDTAGKRVSDFWKECLLNPQNEYAQKYGTCGDQKYLDLFIPLFGKSIGVFDRDTETVIYHAAPWNFSNYEYKNNNEIYNNGKKIELLFNHFSHFKTDFNGNWSSSDHGEWQPEVLNETVRNFYIEYNKKVTTNNVTSFISK